MGEVTHLTSLQRVFIGIPVEPQAQQLIEALLGPVRESSQSIRWVPAANRHLTLAFLGNQPIAVIRSLAGVFDKAYGRLPHFQFNLTRLTRFPDSAGAIIALTAEPDSHLDHLFQITRGLLRNNYLEIDRRRFRPHLTLGRISRGKQITKIFDRSVDISLIINRVILFKSVLTPTGSIYSSIKETRLL